MKEDTRNKLDVIVFRQFRRLRLPGQELKWILPRPVTSSSDEDMVSSDEEMHVYVSAARRGQNDWYIQWWGDECIRRGQSDKTKDEWIRHGQSEKTKKDVSAADKATIQQNTSEMSEGFTKHLLHSMMHFITK